MSVLSSSTTAVHTFGRLTSNCAIRAARKRCHAQPVEQPTKFDLSVNLRPRRRGENSNHDNPHRLRHRPRPGPSRSGRKSRAAGRKLTGISFLSGEVTAKRLELLRELVPAATRVAVLVDPANATYAEITVRETGAAARSVGLQIQVLKASTIG